MFKSRRNLLRKCRDNRQFTGRSTSGTKKVEGNSNITTKRLTIPPGFLCLGINSDTIQKRKNRRDNYTQKDYILKEDIHGLFHSNINENITKLRRSKRISKKIEKSRNLDEHTASNYYPDSLKQRKPNEKENLGIRSYDKNSVLKNNSKSLFREINKQCARIGSQNSTASTIHSPETPTIPSKVEAFRINAFCKNLCEEVNLDLAQDKFLLDLKSAIVEKMQNINQILSGKLIPKAVMEDVEKGNASVVNDRDQTVKNFDYIPKCQWVYETPPRQRIILPKVDECAIQPAVICTTKKQSNIYELNPNVKVNLNNYNHRQNIEVDGRYLKHLASFEDNIQIDMGLDCLDNRNKTDADSRIGDVENNYNYQTQNECSNAQFNYGNAYVNLPENHFMPVISRPRKPATKASRTVFKRKIEELESTPSGSNRPLEADITFINEDGQFKIMNTQCSVDEGNFNLQFKKNLFKVYGEDNLFNFTNEEPNIFDFNQLRKDDC